MKISNKGRDGILLPDIPEPVFLSGRGVLPGTEGFVFFQWKGRQCARRYVKPKDTRTERQLEHRRVFAEISKAWRALSQEERDRYNRRAEMMNMNGFDLFVSEAFKERKKAPGY